jgi:hypothetical protein
MSHRNRTAAAPPQPQVNPAMIFIVPWPKI